MSVERLEGERVVAATAVAWTVGKVQKIRGTALKESVPRTADNGVGEMVPVRVIGFQGYVRCRTKTEGHV